MITLNLWPFVSCISDSVLSRDLFNKMTTQFKLHGNVNRLHNEIQTVWRQNADAKMRSIALHMRQMRQSEFYSDIFMYTTSIKCSDIFCPDKYSPPQSLQLFSLCHISCYVCTWVEKQLSEWKKLMQAALSKLKFTCSSFIFMYFR